MEQIIYRLEIFGRVQGVCYRNSMVEQARVLGIRGWVRNRHSGSVEAMIQGESSAVARMITWARSGPAQATAATVKIHPGSGNFTNFNQCETA